MATALPADELKADGVLDQHEEFKVEETSTDVHYIVDPIIEKRVTRKFDFRILPLLFGIWYEVTFETIFYGDHLLISPF